jgi:pSer/pThr/pTyr-binding forkhead associated (FHA) protein
MIQQLLFVGQILVVVLVYIFVWRVIRTARRDLAGTAGSSSTYASMAAQESTILPAVDVSRARREAGLVDPRIVVESSEVLRPGVPFTIGSGLSLGRGDTNDIVLNDSTVSTRHARIVPPGTVVDEQSTNGTFVNGNRVVGRVALTRDARVQVGSTVFRYEAGSV